MQRHAAPPGARKRSGLRRAAAGKTLFAWMDTTGLARERSMGPASRCQSLSRRLPTAPFAQGSHLCLGKHDWSGQSNEVPRKRLPKGSLFLHFAKIAPRFLPARPEHSGRTTHKAGESMGAASRCSRHGTKKPPGGNLQGVFVQPCSPQRTFWRY